MYFDYYSVLENRKHSKQMSLKNKNKTKSQACVQARHTVKHFYAVGVRFHRNVIHVSRHTAFVEIAQTFAEENCVLPSKFRTFSESVVSYERVNVNGF